METARSVTGSGKRRGSPAFWSTFATVFAALLLVSAAAARAQSWEHPADKAVIEHEFAAATRLVSGPETSFFATSRLVASPDPAASPVWSLPRGSAFAPAGDFYLGAASPLARDWKATWGLLLRGVDDIGGPGWSALLADRVWYETDARRRRDPASWRHFLGVEYTGVERFTLLGGVARSGWNRGGGPAPTGYDGLRLNLGARWRGETWGFESHAAWIPGGVRRAPDDASFLPGHGSGSGSAYLLSLTLSARF